MRIAVVGSGVSGMVAAWLLARRHEVHVFEAAERLGGHTHTLTVDRRARTVSSRSGLADERTPAGRLAVDTGFIVYNEPTYPNFTRLLDELGVASQPSDMSWSLRCGRCGLEYAGTPRGLVAQPRRLADPDYLRLLRDIERFNRVGRRLVDDPRTGALPIGRFLDAAGFSRAFARHYLLPMASAIWSTGGRDIRAFPLGTLLRFFDNHGLLGVTTHHPWRTVRGGSATYLGRLAEPLGGRIHRGDAVVGLSRSDGDVELRTAAGVSTRFDAAVVAAHADEALALLADPTPGEKEMLGAWTYSHNEAWTHTDTDLLPRATAAWASWNYLLDDCRLDGRAATLTYDMNRLQSLDEPERYLVTLNPPHPPAAAKRLHRQAYTHPTFTAGSVATHPGLGALNGRRRTFFAGAYQRYGFHEDGVWSAVRVAADLGVTW